LTAAGVYQRILPSFVIVQATTPSGAELGSGVVVNQNGQVVTALHVVRGATPIRLTFADGTATPATVAATTPESDLVTLAPTNRPAAVVPAVLFEGQLRVGQTVYALGDPLGLTATFTAGVVSGLDRTVPLADGSGQMQHVIQFDAAVDPGSSGGPLVDARGQVVGYVTGLANPTDQGLFVGVG